MNAELEARRAGFLAVVKSLKHVERLTQLYREAQPFPSMEQLDAMLEELRHVVPSTAKTRLQDALLESRHVLQVMSRIEEESV